MVAGSEVVVLFAFVEIVSARCPGPRGQTLAGEGVDAVFAGAPVLAAVHFAVVDVGGAGVASESLSEWISR